MSFEWDERYSEPLISDVREAILLAYGFRCAYTKVDLSHGKFDVDHIIPVAHGGPYNLANYAPANHSFNRARGKTRLPLAEESLALLRAKELAPKIDEPLNQSRGPEGLPRSPIAMRAFILLGLTSRAEGGRRASGKFLHSSESPIAHVRCWCSSK